MNSIEDIGCCECVVRIHDKFKFISNIYELSELSILYTRMYG